MLVISMMGYASEKEKNIPLEKMNYALDHPGIPVTIDSSITKQAENLFYSATKSTVKQIIYKDAKFANLTPKITQTPYIFDWGSVLIFILILFVLGMFASIEIFADFAGGAAVLMIVCDIIMVIVGAVTLLIGSLIVLGVTLAIYIGICIKENFL